MARPRASDPSPSRVENAPPPQTVSEQANDVFDVIQYRTLRKEICHGVRHGTLDRSGIALKLDELHAFSVKQAVVAIEPFFGRSDWGHEAVDLIGQRPSGAYGSGGRQCPLQLHHNGAHGSGRVLDERKRYR